jgi:hypothetical protein
MEEVYIATHDNAGGHRQNMPKGIAYHFKDYCELVYLTGRCIREDKTGYIENSQCPILQRLGLSAEQWLTLTTEFKKHFCYAAGAELMMNAYQAHTHHKRLRGMDKARALFNRAYITPPSKSKPEYQMILVSICLFLDKTLLFPQFNEIKAKVSNRALLVSNN